MDQCTRRINKHTYRQWRKRIKEEVTLSDKIQVKKCQLVTQISVLKLKNISQIIQLNF